MFLYEGGITLDAKSYAYAAELLDQLANVVKKDDWNVIIILELGSVGMVAAADKGERNNEKVHTLRS
ncbi:hypothetical protein SAMN03159341_11690 [Paenibacillus sp. 1_12]|nr:hypothetical protein SAMN03159341_11690 [Paenibacillus sp. 1_12]